VECLADGEVRARRKASDAERRADQDEPLVRSMADGSRRLFPRCPRKRHSHRAACDVAEKRPGRKDCGGEGDGRGPFGLAVVAAVRHGYTRYDDLLMSGMERSAARPRWARQIESWPTGAAEAESTAHATESLPPNRGFPVPVALIIID